MQLLICMALALNCLWSLVDQGYFAGSRATEKLLYIDFGNPEYFLPWNILKQPLLAKDTAEFIVKVCERVWPYLNQSSPQFGNVMRTAVTTLVENGEPLTKMNSLLINSGYRHRLLDGITDPTILEFLSTGLTSEAQQLL